jgi:hypothetical protein
MQETIDHLEDHILQLKCQLQTNLHLPPTSSSPPSTTIPIHPPTTATSIPIPLLPISIPHAFPVPHPIVTTVPHPSSNLYTHMIQAIVPSPTGGNIVFLPHGPAVVVGSRKPGSRDEEVSGYNTSSESPSERESGRTTSATSGKSSIESSSRGGSIRDDNFGSPTTCTTSGMNTSSGSSSTGNSSRSGSSNELTSLALDQSGKATA